MRRRLAPGGRLRAAGVVATSGLLLALVLPGAAAAQGFSAGAECPAGNLLSGAKPWRYADIRGAVVLVTDDAVAPEGAQWNASPAVVLDTGAATLTYDLGRAMPLAATYLQADANDTYTVWGSVDGASFKELGRAQPVEGHGLRSRSLNLGGVLVRYLRVGEGSGDGSYSISEFQAFCRLPDPFPPKLKVVNAPPAAVATNFFTYWNDDASARWELVLALLGVAFLGWELKLRQQGKANAHRRMRTRLLAIMGVLSGLTYFNLGFFHFGNYTHDWEWTHYYVGSKYFRELSYDRLYECIAVADTEDGLRRRVELRKLTNLRTNALESTDDILKHPERCTKQFSADRWQSFKRDVTFFRNRQNARRWDDLQTDHGYNGTPVWNIAGSVLANLAPASVNQLYLLSLLDPAYFLGMCAVVWWAFGWRVLSIGLLAFATNFPSRFYWTGGAFLRWDWLFYLVAAVACLRRERYLLGGLSLGYATLLRVFPGFLFVGPLLAAGIHLYQKREIDRRWLSFFGGAALSAILLIPASIGVAGGAKAYLQFVQNTQKHKETPLTNYMGLRTVLAYRPGEAGRNMRNDNLTDPWKPWKDARLRAYRQARPVLFLAVAGFLVLLGLAVKGREPWVVVALSSSFVAVGVELTCYYYAFIMALALLYEKREEVGRILLIMTAFTGFIAWAPLKGMATWLDEQYTWMSVGTLVAFVMILWMFGPGERRAALAAAAAADDGKSAPAPVVPGLGPQPDSDLGANTTGKKKKRR